MKRRWIAIALAFVGMLGLGFATVSGSGRDGKSDAFQVGSVWHGMGEQANSTTPWPAVFFITSRVEEKFKATAWYPTLANGLIQATGTVGAKGDVTIFETLVIHGAPAAGNIGVMAGSQYAGRVEKNVLTCTGEWPDPKTQEPVKLKLVLKLAD